MRKNLSILGILILCILAIIGNTGCSVLQKLGITKDHDELRPVSSVVLGEDEAAKIMGKNPVRLYFSDENNTKLRTEIRYIKIENEEDIEGLATIIAEELIKGPGKNTGLKAVIPKDVKLKKPVTIEKRTAIVDLSKEFIENHPGGKDLEKLTIYSIVNSLTEIKGIEKIEFRIEGESKSKFKGGFKFDIPFVRSSSIISKEPPVKGEIEGSADIKEENGEKTNEEDLKETFGEYDEEEVLE